MSYIAFFFFFEKTILLFLLNLFKINKHKHIYRFTTVLNGTCGVRLPIVQDSINVELKGEDFRFYLKNEVCSVYNTSTGVYSDECEISALEDRHTYFELTVFMWCGQMLLFLFGFTSLFKPSFKTTVIYTCIVWFVAAVGCWYQGFGFWLDQDRVLKSGIYPAIFLFTSAAAVNIYSAHVMHDLELRLVISSHALQDNRFQAPSGEKVVYVKADVVGAEQLTLEAGPGMDHAVAHMQLLTQQLGKEYFGTSITLDGNIIFLTYIAFFGQVQKRIYIYICFAYPFIIIIII